MNVLDAMFYKNYK